MTDKTSDKVGTEIKKTFCWASPGCHDLCGINVSVKDGRIVKVRGNRQLVNGSRIFQNCPDRIPNFTKWPRAYTTQWIILKM